MTDPLLEVENLTIKYETADGMLTAVSDASFSIDKNEYVGLIGESGCGKSTMIKAIVRGLATNGRVTSGRILYDGEDIVSMSEKAYNDRIRWKEISYIPQGSMSNLDPLQRIDKKVIEVAKAHTDLSRAEALATFSEMLEIVGLSDDRLAEYPHQLSGGMKQRIAIALALFLEPSLLIADEPTTALDVIMQDQIFKYLHEIRSKTDTSLLLVTHDISLVFESSDQAVVMHAGQIAESGSVTAVYDDPHHPYTLLLSRAFPDIRDPQKALSVIEGTPPQMYGDVSRCTFADRCALATEECRLGAPALTPVGAESDHTESHRVACYHSDKIDQLEASSSETPPYTE